MSVSRPKVVGVSALLVLVLAAAAALVLALSRSGSAQAAGSIPAAKTSVVIDNLIDLSQTASGPPNGSNDTGWQDVLRTQIKTSSQKDLVFDAAMQCGIVTDTTVKSSGGTQPSATARGTVSVRVLVDGVPADPTNSIDATKATAEGV